MQDKIQKLIQSSDIRHIAIEGVIGAGKTSLALRLAETLGGKAVLEQFEENPFLAKFYDDPDRFAFQAQIFFLLNRFKQYQALFQVDLFERWLVTDYILEKDKIFAYLNLNDDELKLYEALATNIQHSVPAPDLVVYLQSSVDRLMDNIKKRGRPYEKNMSDDYIRDLNEAFNYFFFRYKSAPLLIVNSTQIDFVNNEQHFEDLLGEIFRPNKAPVEYYNPGK